MPNTTHRPLTRALTATIILALFAAAIVIVSCRSETAHPPERVTTAAPVGIGVTRADQQRELVAGITAAKADQLARWYEWAAAQPPPRRSVVHGSQTANRGSGSHRTDAEIEACIIARENGGDYGRSTNPTHFGRYQFSRGTWAANGGDPDTWGSASPEEQDAVFRATVERNGYRDWTPYNGCG